MTLRNYLFYCSEPPEEQEQSDKHALKKTRLNSKRNLKFKVTVEVTQTAKTHFGLHVDNTTYHVNSKYNLLALLKKIEPKCNKFSGMQDIVPESEVSIKIHGHAGGKGINVNAGYYEVSDYVKNMVEDREDVYENFALTLRQI